MRNIIYTDKAPAPIGPYSQAVKVGNTVYTSGQIALDPDTMELVTADVQTETRQVMKNLKQVLTQAGMSFDDVVKVTIFITNMDDFASINSVYGTYFNEESAPARETVQVAALPKGVSVEISAIAIAQ